MTISLAELKMRMDEIGAQSPVEGDRRSLLHAYIACLSFSDLCIAIAATLHDPTHVRLALRGRLLRLLREGRLEIDLGAVIELVEQTATASDQNKFLRQVTDALHSAVFTYLPLPNQQALLDRWSDRGSRGTMARWLKATKEHPALFDAQVALSYWRTSKDERAAKSLAYQAPLAVLMKIINEIVDISETGWIIARAVVRAEFVDQHSWDLIQNRHPATFLYLSAQMRRPITEDQAFESVCRCSGRAADGDRGLAIWAVGQMGMTVVLDRIHEALAALYERDEAEWLDDHPELSRVVGLPSMPLRG